MRVHCLALVLLILLAPVCAAEASGFGVDDLLSDYDCFWMILEENWPFWSILPETGVQTESLRQEYQHALTASSCDERSFLALMTELTARMGNPAHLEMIGPAAYDSYVALIEEGVYAPDSVEALLLRDPKTAQFYVSLPRPASANRTPIGPSVSYVPDTQILTLRFSSFSHSRLAYDRNFTADCVQLYPEARHIVFDITGNAGGSDYYWMDNIVAPFGGSYEYGQTAYLCDTAINRQYGLMEHAVPDAAPPAAAASLGLTHRLETNISVPSAYFDGRTFSSSAKRWLLVDENVFSAADSFAAFCRQTGWACVVGRATRGDGCTAAPVLVRLPRTGLLLRFSGTAGMNADDQTLNALSGTLPDHPAKPNESPMATCLRLIRAEDERLWK